MMSVDKYNKAFVEGLDIEEWDSIGHMSLMSALEDEFDISLETDDIVDFSSYEKGIEILKKYNVKI